MNAGRISRTVDSMHRGLRRICMALAVAAVVGGFLSAVGLTIFQIFGWLRSGHWFLLKSKDLFDVSASFLSDWSGARRLLDWALDTPMQVSLVICGLIAGWVFSRAADVLDPPAAK